MQGYSSGKWEMYGLPQVIKGAHITQLSLKFLAFPHFLS